MSTNDPESDDEEEDNDAQEGDAIELDKQEMLRPSEGELDLVEEVRKRVTGSFSGKCRLPTGQFSKKDTCDLSWRNYVRAYYQERPGLSVQCCKRGYTVANSLITHLFRHHISDFATS